MGKKNDLQYNEMQPVIYQLNTCDILLDIYKYVLRML